jgi:Fe-S oxidoreductase
MKPIAPGGAAIPRATAASVWPDTFNNYFRPDTAIAATRLLEGLGFQVDIPAAPLCCGRPLYDWGWVDQAKALWRNTLGAMAEDIRSGVPVIGLEPACVSAFRDELPNLFPGDAQAQALSKQTRFLTEFLKDRGLSPAPPDLHAPLLVQFHCHHHSVLDKKAESELIKALPAPSQVLQHGCCGMAGAFGFEVAKYASLARSPSTACCRTSPTRRKTRSSSPMASAAAR